MCVLQDSAAKFFINSAPSLKAIGQDMMRAQLCYQALTCSKTMPLETCEVFWVSSLPCGQVQPVEWLQAGLDSPPLRTQPSASRTIPGGVPPCTKINRYLQIILQIPRNCFIFKSSESSALISSQCIKSLSKHPLFQSSQC